MADTTIVASAEQPFSHEVRRPLLGIYDGQGKCIELYIPNILEITSRRNRVNPSWLTSPRYWDALTNSGKCSAVLAHELEHRFDDEHWFGVNWEVMDAEEKLEKKASFITYAASTVTGGALALGIESICSGINPASIGLGAFALANVAYGGYRTNQIIRRRGYYKLPHEERANQAAIDNTNQFVTVTDKADADR